MSNKDWDLDELLNFQYDKPQPEEIPSKRPSLEEVAMKEAQEEAYRRYRQERNTDNRKISTKTGKRNKKSKKPAKSRTNADRANSKFYKFTKILCVPYVLLFALFVVSMTIMNMLPFLMLIALYVVLGLLSLIIVIQLSKDNIKKWAKIVATVMAIILMISYGVGTAYAFGTVSFLGENTVKNENSVGSITKEPFNVLITGMDVWGRIKRQGRSDVNMVVTVNPQTETVLMTSIPRDYEVRLPDKGYATDKLTHSGFYGLETTVGAIEDLLAVKTNYYVKANFTTIIKFIDAVGGLDFYNPYDFSSAIAPYHYEKGDIHLDGRASLYYARERKAFLTGDNQRVKNQQLIFSLMIEKATSSTTMLLSYNKVLSNLSKNFEMNFSPSEVRALVKFQLAKRPEWKIFKNSLEGGSGSMPTYSTGSTSVYVTTQDPTSIANAQNLIQAVKDGKQLKQDKNGNIKIVETTEETDD